MIKVGKTTNDLVSNIWNKSGKDRCLQKVPYMEYMPHDFNSKNVFIESKYTQPDKSFENIYPTTSRQTSAFSLAQDSGLNSEDYLDESDTYRSK